MQPRDMTEKLFLAICNRHGLTVESNGSVLLTDRQTHLWRLDGGKRRRDQLDYLLKNNPVLPKCL
jgi:hypothetical protein